MNSECIRENPDAASVYALGSVNVQCGKFAGPPATVSGLTDVFLILLIFASGVVLRPHLGDQVITAYRYSLSVPSAPVCVLCLTCFILSFMLVACRYGLYPLDTRSSHLQEITLTIKCALSAGLLMCGGLYMVYDPLISKLIIVLMVITIAAALCVQRVVWQLIMKRKYSNRHNLRNVVILGTGQLSHALGQHISRDRGLGYRLRGFVTTGAHSGSHKVPHEQVIGSLEILRQLTRQYFIDVLVISEPGSTEETIQLVEEARELKIDVQTISWNYSEAAPNAPTEYMGAFPTVSLHRCDSRKLELFIKGAADVAISGLVLTAMLPVMLLIALMICLESDGPAFYVSERIGRRGRVFPFFKFRTMVKNADSMIEGLASMNERDGILFKLGNDPRVTRVGSILRKYSLDELPQLLNVLRGEMSIVGPRPPIASEVERYDIEHLRRLDVMPGLTGLWQVQARQDPSFARYIALDTAYVENWNLLLDLKIIVRTVGVLVRGTGS